MRWAKIWNWNMTGCRQNIKTEGANWNVAESPKQRHNPYPLTLGQLKMPYYILIRFLYVQNVMRTLVSSCARVCESLQFAQFYQASITDGWVAWNENHYVNVYEHACTVLVSWTLYCMCCLSVVVVYAAMYIRCRAQGTAQGVCAMCVRFWCHTICIGTENTWNYVVFYGWLRWGNGVVTAAEVTLSKVSLIECRGQRNDLQPVQLDAGFSKYWMYNVQSFACIV